MTDPDDEPTEDELREAEELARALERGNAGNALPEEALGTAAMLHYARRGAPLPTERSEEILKEALAGTRIHRAAPRRFMLLSALGLSMAAALVLFLTRSEAPPTDTALPSPPTALLSAQLSAARADVGSTVALSVEMRPYRERVYAALEERYPR